MRVMIVEDQTMIRSLLESYFRAEDGYRITASIPGAKQAVEVCRTNSVDLILMGFDFLLVQPQAFIEKKKPHLILFPD